MSARLSYGMTANVYRFRNFKLDTQARELHLNGDLVTLPVSTLDCLIYLIQQRHRTVGRDELTSAVWGRVDISEVSLSHAIMRLRRLLGDSGNDQNSIRTLPRLGYRWIVEPTIEEAPATTTNARQESSSPATAPEGGRQAIDTPEQTVMTAPHANALRGRWKLLLTVVLLSLVALALLWNAHRFDQPKADGAPGPHVAAMVLPTQVDADSEWSWLRFGFMDLVANRLRKGDLTTTPSETVVGLVNAHRIDPTGVLQEDAALNAKSTLLIQPRVALVNGLWNVRLEAHGDGRHLIAEAQAKDVLAAGRTVADDLLAKLGHVPPTDSDSPTPSELAQRVNAAVLAGQLQVGAELIRNAPAAARNSPEVALSSSAIAFFAGEYESSRAQAEALLDRLPADKYPAMRARVFNRLGTADVRLDRNEEADKAFLEAIRLLALQNDPSALATAYTGRGVVAGQAQRLDEAATYFGRARTLHEMSNDAFGVARVDLNLGAVAMDRGLPASAIPIFQDAATRFESLSTPEALNSALRSLADAQSMLLEHADALATTDRFWPVAAHSHNPREGWWLTLSRAVVLASNGRLHDADELIARIRQDSDAEKDAIVRIENEGFAADLALARGDYTNSAALAKSALTPELETTNWQDYAGTWSTLIRALQRGGQVAAAADEIARFRTWAGKDDRRSLYVALADADQARLENRSAAAIQLYADAMAKAERLAIPEDMVVVGEPYTAALLDAGQVDRASAIAGRLAQWIEKDMRVAWIQATVYQALGKADAARTAFERARRLAGERRLPEPGSSPPAPH